MSQLLSYLNLSYEPRAADGGRKFVTQHLDCDRMFGAEIDREIDVGRRAAPEFAGYRESIGERSTNVLKRRVRVGREVLSSVTTPRMRLRGSGAAIIHIGPTVWELSLTTIDQTLRRIRLFRNGITVDRTTSSGSSAP